MNYQYQEWADGKTCQRCSAEIHTGWIVDGKTYGPTCGKKILRQAGITWPAKYGPGSFDRSAMAHAVELNRRYEHGRWVYSYEIRKAHKEIVGIIGWKIAQAIAKNGALKLNSDDATRCYEAARAGFKEGAQAV